MPPSLLGTLTSCYAGGSLGRKSPGVDRDAPTRLSPHAPRSAARDVLRQDGPPAPTRPAIPSPTKRTRSANTLPSPWSPHLPWEQKLKYLSHALKRHCQPAPLPRRRGLDVLPPARRPGPPVRRQEALRIASPEDDLYAARLAMGQLRDKIAEDAEIFFAEARPRRTSPRVV